MRYQHVVAEVFHKPWAILPEKFAVIAQIVSLRSAGVKLTEDEILARLDQAAISAGPHSQQSSATVAVIPIRGIISQRINVMSQISGGTSIDKLTAQFRSALADRSVGTIVFDVDSPGGSVGGVPELADEIYKSRGQKKSIAVANGMAASAAYWLAASAGEMVVIPSGEVGSIGVFSAHEDFSKALEAEGVKVSLISAGKFKVDGNPYEPLSDSARADLQSKVDAFYGMFSNSVARGRRATQAAVRAGFGQGRMVLAAQAVKEGMADRVATMDDVFSRLVGRETSAGPENKRFAAANIPASRSIESMRRELDLMCGELDAHPSDNDPQWKIDLDQKRRELDLI
jgi:signal peptide peptidase SppA